MRWLSGLAALAGIVLGIGLSTDHAISEAEGRSCQLYLLADRHSRAMYVFGSLDGLETGAYWTALHALDADTPEAKKAARAVANRAIERLMPSAFRIRWLVDEVAEVCKRAPDTPLAAAFLDALDQLARIQREGAAAPVPESENPYEDLARRMYPHAAPSPAPAASAEPARTPIPF